MSIKHSLHAHKVMRRGLISPNKRSAVQLYHSQAYNFYSNLGPINSVLPPHPQKKNLLQHVNCL